MFRTEKVLSLKGLMLISSDVSKTMVLLNYFEKTLYFRSQTCIFVKLPEFRRNENMDSVKEDRNESTSSKYTLEL